MFPQSTLLSLSYLCSNLSKYSDFGIFNLLVVGQSMYQWPLISRKSEKLLEAQVKRVTYLDEQFRSFCCFEFVYLNCSFSYLLKYLSDKMSDLNWRYVRGMAIVLVKMHYLQHIFYDTSISDTKPCVFTPANVFVFHLLPSAGRFYAQGTRFADWAMTTTTTRTKRQR